VTRERLFSPPVDLTRQPGPDLRARIADTGYTPGRADLPRVVACLASDDEDVVRDAERALVRAGSAAGASLLACLADATPPLRARLTRTLGRLAAVDPGLRPSLLTCLEDPDPKTRRNAALALGKLDADADTAAALLARARQETRPEQLRSFAEALGKSGGPEALAWLAGLDVADPELQRLRGRAQIMLQRSLSRGATAAGIDEEAVAPTAQAMMLTCRPGLEDILADELAALHPRIAGPGRVSLTSAGPLAAIVQARTLLTVGFPLAPVAVGRAGLEAALVTTLAGPAAQAVFSTWTKGQVRYRLAWARGGHRRAVVWRVAEALATACPALVNDPTASGWDVVVDDAGGAVNVELRPRWHDTRFAYRVADVPAASHPTLAAAVARLGGVRADDVVWDPFVGSGLELVERGRLGPYARLHGSDLDARALAAATANLDAAGLADHALVEADATVHAPAGVTLILTNPPMGRRVHRGDVAPLLTSFLAHAGTVLRPGGRLVWISPLPRVTRAAALQAGLRCQRTQTVDMGGFTGQLEVWVQRPT
jgi:23S rRNA G2445 N2-methylase RlmL